MDKSKDILILWVATIPTTTKILATLTAFDHAMSSSRSTIVPILNLRNSQLPETFLSQESNYLMLNRGEINILSNNGQNSIELEIFIHECD